MRVAGGSNPSASISDQTVPYRLTGRGNGQSQRVRVRVAWSILRPCDGRDDEFKSRTRTSSRSGKESRRFIPIYDEPHTMVQLDGATDTRLTYTSGSRGRYITLGVDNREMETTYEDRSITFAFDTPDGVEVHDVTSCFQTDNGTWELLTEISADSRILVDFAVRRDGDRDEIRTQEVTVKILHDNTILDTATFTVHG